MPRTLIPKMPNLKVNVKHYVCGYLDPDDWRPIQGFRMVFIPDMCKQALGNALKANVAHLMPLRYHICAIGVVQKM